MIPSITLALVQTDDSTWLRRFRPWLGFRSKEVQHGQVHTIDISERARPEPGCAGCSERRYACRALVTGMYGGCARESTYPHLSSEKSGKMERPFSGLRSRLHAPAVSASVATRRTHLAQCRWAARVCARHSHGSGFRLRHQQL